MKRHLHIVSCAMLLAAAFVANTSHAQDAPPVVLAPATTFASTLPPIFTPGSKIFLSTKNFQGTIVVREVRGDWVLVNIPGESAAWIHPASLDATWGEVK